MAIGVSTKGSFRKTTKYLEGLAEGDIYSGVAAAARRGVDALAAATPIESGETAQSWAVEIEQTKESVKIRWVNNHINQGACIAMLIQYGHGTGTGGFVQGYDYINPAIRPIFDQIAKDVWKEVTRG